MKLLVPAYLLCASLALFLCMAADKRAAQRHGPRISEAALLSLAVLGGAAGGLLAMVLFRHKTRKAAFAAGLPLILLAHAGLILFFLRISEKAA